MKALTIEDVSPKAVRSAQLWLMGYLATATDTNADYDEWNYCDGWDLNLYHYGETVNITAYPVIDGVITSERWVYVAQGTVKPQDDTHATEYKELAEQILGGK